MSNTKKRVLFVDDETSFLSGLRRMLHRQETVWDMTFADSVDAAMEKVGKHDYDAIISDINMPGRDGFALLKELQGSKRTEDIPVVMLTAGRDDDLKCLALNLGATDLVDKPIHRDDLLARIRSVLRLKSTQDELKELNASLEQKVAERTQEIKWSQLDIIWHLAKVGEYRDEQTGQHIARVACYARTLAEEMHLPNEFIETLYMTAPLHDIGKVGIPDSILLKRGELTPEERRVMEQHCRIGHKILTEGPDDLNAPDIWPGGKEVVAFTSTQNKLLTMAASIALSHHERWDGQGYPDGLKGDETPLEARIVALADVYDALTSDRPYKFAMSDSQTCEVLEGGPGSHFDPDVYAAFEKLTEQFRTIRARLSNKVCLTP